MFTSLNWPHSCYSSSSSGLQARPEKGRKSDIGGMEEGVGGYESSRVVLGVPQTLVHLSDLV